MSEESLLGWEALEYEPKNNSADWYWATGIVTVAIVVICILFNNILFGIIIGLSSALLMFYTKREPRVIEIEITTKGIRHDSRKYLFEHLDSYHIDDEDTETPKLVLKSKKLLMPYIIIRMDGARPHEVEQILGNQLTKGNHPEPITHKLLSRLGF